MAQTDDRVQLIGSAIINQAEQEARKIIDEANGIREREMDIAKNETIGKMFVTVQDKATSIRQAAVRAIAKEELEARRAILHLRESKTEEIFGSVKERLLAYADTDACGDEMLKRAQALKGAYREDTNVIFVRERDRALGVKIAEALGGRAETDASIKIGGFKLRNDEARVLVDETLDERLAEQRLWFLQNCGMKVSVDG